MKKLVFVGPIIFLILWWVITYFKFVSPLLVPNPFEVLSAFPVLFGKMNLLNDLISSFLRMASGFLISATIGIPLGLVIGYWKRLYLSVEFLIDFFRSLPATALFPIFLLFFGIGDTAKISVVVFSCTLIIIVNTTYGVKSCNSTRIMVAKLMKANKFQVFSKTIFPDSLPHIAAGLRIALSNALIIVIVTEMFIGTYSGLGQKIYDMHLTYQIPEMYATIIVCGCLGFCINKLFLVVESKFVHWIGK